MPGYRKLGRTSAHRKAMLRNLVTDLLREGRITTTDTRAKEARRQAEKMITLAKRGDLHARRQALAYVYDETVRIFGVVLNGFFSTVSILSMTAIGSFIFTSYRSRLPSPAPISINPCRSRSSRIDL